jgi:hypothetical protein
VRRLVLLLLLLAGCTPRERPPAVPPVANPKPVAVDELAVVERIHCAHAIAPDETLAVRLSGSIGPDGSWALDRVAVERTQDGVVLIPRVRRVAGDMFIQMVIPLDHIERLALSPGTHRVRGRGRGGELEEVVRVEPGVVRAPPEVTLRTAPAVQQGEQEWISVTTTARCEDGFIARVEMRQVGAGDGPWTAPESMQAEGDSVMAWFTVRRPPGDARRRIEVRAVDGQGEATSPPAALVLPAR